MKARTVARGITIVCLADRRRSPLSRVMRHAGFTVIDSFTADQVVAICVNNSIDAVVLDQDLFVETEGWSVAQSLKLVRPKLCVLLVSRATRLHDRLPKGVDAVVPQEKPQLAVAALRKMLGLEDAASA
jgi:DNA-binding response OmpR family regulator